MNTTPPRPEGLRAPGTGPTDPDPPTRKKLPFWDRIKFLLGLTIAFLVLVWNALTSFEGIMGFRDAVIYTANDRWGIVILTLMAAEVVRQLHFLISERWAGYHRLWTKGVFGGFERWSHRRFNDWTRFRIARAVKVLFWIVVLAIVLAAIYDTDPLSALIQAPVALWNVLPMVLQLAFAFFFIAFQFIGLFWFLSRGGVETYFPDDIKTRFSDVWGQDHVVERVKENIVFLEKPDEIEARGGYVPSGLLLWGPPGTGKTLMAEAVAGETGKPYVFVDPGAFVNMFMGVGILKVKSLFRKLRKLALRYGGVIVFFDEADSLGSRGTLAVQGPPTGRGGFSLHTPGCHGFSYLSEDARALLVRNMLSRHDPAPPDTGRSRFFVGGMGGANMGTLQALLTELSGLKKPRGFVNRYVRRLLGMRPKPPPKYRILVMMATNMPNSLDEALLRPGRIDRIYKVGYPSKAGRLRTYQGYFAKVRHELTDEQLDKLATITPYATGATIKDLVNESLIMAIRDGREVITWADVMKAKRLKQLGPPEDVEYIERERHAVAVHEACHAVVAYRTRRHMEIDIATIEKGADYLGMVSSIKPEDQFTRWKSEHEADIMVSLASLAGERMFFDGDNSSGVSGDLMSATYLVGLMEAHWGMGQSIAALPALQELGIAPGRAQRDQPGGPQVPGLPGDSGRGTPNLQPDLLSERVEYNLVRILKQTEELLRANRREILSLAHALETHKTLSGEDVIAVIEGTQGPLVNGEVYKDDAFYEKIEAYHQAAVEAHRTHSTVTVELPVPQPVIRLHPAQVVSAPVSGNGAAPAGALVAPPPPPPPPALPDARPDFVPWTVRDAPPPPPPPPPGPAAADPGTRTGSRRGVWLLLAGAVTLIALALLGAVLLTTALPPAAEGATVAGLPSGVIILLLLIAMAMIGTSAVAYAVVKGMQASRATAEAARERAAERAQLLAAAMDPEVAMRLLGYRGPHEPNGGR